MASSQTSGLVGLGLLASRLCLGAWFALCGWGKLGSVGAGRYVELHLGEAMQTLPEHLARYYLTALPFLEIGVGLLLALGFMTRIGALLGAVLLTGDLIGMTGPGFYLETSPTAPFPAEVVYLALALLLVAAGSGSLALDRRVLGKSKPAEE